MPAMLSDVVADLVAAADKVRADDRLITSSDQMLNEVEAIVDTITALQAVVTRRVRGAFHADATEESCGRGMKGWLHEELMLAGSEAARYVRLLHYLPRHPLTEPRSTRPRSRSGMSPRS